jgi:hypothetical protein
MRRPRTLMWSRAGSAFVPNSRTTSPLTVTSPASINSSAWRRDASPAAAINFCRRSSKGFSSTPTQAKTTAAPVSTEASQAFINARQV